MQFTLSFVFPLLNLPPLEESRDRIVVRVLASHQCDLGSILAQSHV